MMTNTIKSYYSSHNNDSNCIIKTYDCNVSFKPGETSQKRNKCITM